MKIWFVDTVHMYPSIKLSSIIKAKKLFTKGLTSAANQTTRQQLKLNSFGIRYTIMFFGGEYYKYYRGGKALKGLKNCS